MSHGGGDSLQRLSQQQWGAAPATTVEGGLRGERRQRQSEVMVNPINIIFIII